MWRTRCTPLLRHRTDSSGEKGRAETRACCLHEYQFDTRLFLLTRLPSWLSCRPMQQQAQSKSNQHACTFMSLTFFMTFGIPYGPMMARASDVGTVTLPSCADMVPIGVIELGTSASQLSSCSERTGPLFVYHEPACVALRTTILANIEYRNCLKQSGDSSWSVEVGSSVLYSGWGKGAPVGPASGVVHSSSSSQFTAGGAMNRL